ncbi:MAG TPA: hypothetical protein VJ553_05425 [Candidatus Paceibacterota bacterium]|nr:hypothetical protein [Candidatus Paceibacterota bacterium]
MAIYSLANRTTMVTIANACLEIRTTATERAKILEIVITMAAATASVFGIGRPQAIGGTPTSPLTVLAEEFAEPTGSTTTALAWAVGPTVPLYFFRRVNLPATIGAGRVLTFPRGLVIPVSSSIVIWNITACGVSDIEVVLDE